jgi:putative transposase
MDIEGLGIKANVQRVFRARQKINDPGLISHITQRAAGKEPLFVQDSDYLTMLGLLKESSEKFNLNYYALCLMPNHVHLLLEPAKKNLSDAMRSIFSRYAAAFNQKYQRRGHLFGGPYRQSICLDQTYLLSASVYIHLNPVRAGIVDDANAYRWSSSSLYCQEKSTESFVNPQPVLKLVHDDEPEARKQYKVILKTAHTSELDNALEQEGAIEKFCVRLAEIFPRLFKKLGKKSPNFNNRQTSLLELTRLEQELRETEFFPVPLCTKQKGKKIYRGTASGQGFQKNRDCQTTGNITHKHL